MGASNPTCHEAARLKPSKTGNVRLTTVDDKHSFWPQKQEELERDSLRLCSTVQVTISNRCNYQASLAKEPIGSHAGSIVGSSSKACSNSAESNDLGAAISNIYSSNHESFIA